MSGPLPAEVLDLLAAIRAALDVPRAVPTDADEQARYRLLHERTHSARIALNGILDHGHDLTGATDRLNERTDDSPIQYTVWAEPEGGTS